MRFAVTLLGLGLALCVVVVIKCLNVDFVFFWRFCWHLVSVPEKLADLLLVIL